MISTQQRPLAPLANEHLLCSGWLSNWRSPHSTQGQDICVQSIDCRDWDTGKQQLAHLDHGWLRMSRQCWKTLYRLGLRDGHQTRRLDPVFFLAKPEYYRRADGSEDWGLYLLSCSPPTTQVQADGVRSEFRRLSKPGSRLAQPEREFNRILMTTYLLENQLEDWRLYSKRGPAAAMKACTQARRNAEAGLRHLWSQQRLESQAREVRRLCQQSKAQILRSQSLCSPQSQVVACA